ncbi:unnamed protein product [Oikopleura dioica]|uniref:Uncharacterized protein n=1 Tax=Oikopleura dioica TaxID=34765 RepID=E4Z1I1_OIKDI|nr:unnamed protein product [Oikopleura dioica]
MSLILLPDSYLYVEIKILRTFEVTSL